MACSVRPGSRAEIFCHLWPSSSTERMIVLSSAADQLTRSAGLSSSVEHVVELMRVGDGATSIHCRSASDHFTAEGGLGSLKWLLVCSSGSTEWPPLCTGRCLTRFHRLRTESSDRSGSMDAISRHLQPCSRTPATIIASSSLDHAVRAARLRPWWRPLSNVCTAGHVVMRAVVVTCGGICAVGAVLMRVAVVACGGICAVGAGGYTLTGVAWDGKVCNGTAYDAVFRSMAAGSSDGLAVMILNSDGWQTTAGAVNGMPTGSEAAGGRTWATGQR